MQTQPRSPTLNGYDATWNLKRPKAAYRIFLLLLMFVVIFGPKSAKWGDVLSMACIAVAALSMVIPLKDRLPGAVTRHFTLCASCGIFLFLYCAIHYLLSSHPDPHQCMRFGRMLVNLLGVVSLVKFYHSAYGPIANDVVACDIVRCLVLHAFVMLGMFLSPSFNSLIVTHCMSFDESNKYFDKFSDAYRIAGLTGSWDATSGLQSIGLLAILPCLSSRNAFSAAYVAVALPVLLFSIMISGRTGLVTIAILAPLVIAIIPRRDLLRVAKPMIVAAVLLSIISAAVAPLFGDSIFHALESSAVSRCFAMLGLDVNDTRSSHISFEDTFEIIKQHYFLPSDGQTLLFGNGRSGREYGFVVAADNGFVLNLHAVGVFGILVMYGLAAIQIATSWRFHRSGNLSGTLALISMLCILAIDSKVSYMFSRNGLSVAMLSFFAAQLSTKTRALTTQMVSSAFSPRTIQPLVNARAA